MIKRTNTRKNASKIKRSPVRAFTKSVQKRLGSEYYGNELGQFLAEARKLKSLTMAEVAEVVGLKSGQSIWDWENGKGSGIPADTLLKLVKLYGINAEDAYEQLIRFHQERVRQKIHLKFERAKSKSLPRRASS